MNSPITSTLPMHYNLMNEYLNNILMIARRIARLVPPIIISPRLAFCSASEYFTESRQFWRAASSEAKLSAKSPQSVEELLQSYILEHCPKGQPLKTLQFIDRYCAMSWMMNLGPEKRRILEKVTAEHRVRKVLEIGTYCGYSALALAHSPLQPDAKIVSLEINKRYAEIAKRILAHSGVRNVNVVSETIYEAVSLLNESGPFDLVLMDQEKEQYLDDLRFLEERNLIRTGGLVIADNVIFPGAPDYVAFMRDSASRKQYRSTLYHCYDAYTDIPDGVLVSQKVY